MFRELLPTREEFEAEQERLRASLEREVEARVDAVMQGEARRERARRERDLAGAENDARKFDRV